MRHSELSDFERDRNQASSEKRSYWSVILCLGVLVLLTRVPTLYFHYIDWDEAAMMAEAWAMTQGQVLYKDISQIHPVLQFLIMAPFFRVLKVEWVPFAIKGMNLCLVLFGALLIERLAYRWLASRPLSLFGGLIFIFYCSAAWSLSSYGEFYAIFPILLSTVLLYMGTTRLPHFYMIGGLWSIAFFFKQSAIFDAIGLYVGFLCLDRNSVRSKATATWLMGAGFLTVAIGVSIYFFFSGALSEAWYSMVLRPLLYTRSGEIGGQWPSLARRVLFHFGPSLTAAALGVAYVIGSLQGRMIDKRPNGKPFFFVLLIWFCFDLLGLRLAGRFYDHYLLQLVPQAALLPLFILDQVGLRKKRYFVTVAATCFFAFSTSAFARDMYALARANWVPEPVKRSNAVALYIREHSGDSDRIFLYKTENLDIFFLSQRLSNNGIYNFAGMMAEHMHDQAQQERKQKQFLSNLPAVIVVDPDFDRTDASFDVRRMSLEFFEGALEKHYALKATLSGLRLYFRVERPASSGARMCERVARARRSLHDATSGDCFTQSQ